MARTASLARFTDQRLRRTVAKGFSHAREANVGRWRMRLFRAIVRIAELRSVAERPRVCVIHTLARIQYSFTILQLNLSVVRYITHATCDARGRVSADATHDFLRAHRWNFSARNPIYASVSADRNRGISASSTDRNTRSFARRRRRIVLRGANRLVGVTGEQSSARDRTSGETSSASRRVFRARKEILLSKQAQKIKAR